MNYMSLGKLLVNNGLTFVGQHSISAPQDIQYHVPCESASKNTLVFHKRGIQFILICSHHEAKRILHDDTYNHDWWQLQFIVNPLPYSELYKTIPAEERKKYHDDYWYDSNQSGFKFIGYNEYPVLEQFQANGSSSGPNCCCYKYSQQNTKTAIPTNDLVSIIMKATNELLPNLAPGRFPKIPLHRFYDSYAFNDGITHNYIPGW